MKRSLNKDDDPMVSSNEKTKKTKIVEQEEENDSGFVHIDEDLLFEILKHADSKSLARAACVNKQWHKTAEDERLWEMICTRHWGNTGCGNQQLRSVVLALGGFRRLHSLYLWPLLKKPPSSSSVLYTLNSSLASSSPSSTSSSSKTITSSNSKGKLPNYWGKDEVHLSLSLLSIRYYERMSLSTRGGSSR